MEEANEMEPQALVSILVAAAITSYFFLLGLTIKNTIDIGVIKKYLECGQEDIE